MILLARFRRQLASATYGIAFTLLINFTLNHSSLRDDISSVTHIRLSGRVYKYCGSCHRFSSVARVSHLPTFFYPQSLPFVILQMRPSFSALTILVCALGSPVSAAPIDQARADNRDADGVHPPNAHLHVIYPRLNILLFSGSPTHIEARILDIGTVLNNVAKGAGSLVNNVVSKAGGYSLPQLPIKCSSYRLV